MDVDLTDVPPVRVSGALHQVLSRTRHGRPEVGQIWRSEFAGWSAHIVIRHDDGDELVASPIDDRGPATGRMLDHEVRWEPAVRVRLPRYALDVRLGQTPAEPDATVAGQLRSAHPLAVVVTALAAVEPAAEGLADLLQRHGVSREETARLLGLGGSGVLALARDRYLPTAAELELLSEASGVPVDRLRAAAPTVPLPLGRALRQPLVRERLRRLAARVRPPFELQFIVARQAMLAGQRSTGPGEQDWVQVVDDVLRSMEAEDDET